MTETEISRLLGLQKSAYELLLWINTRAQTDTTMLSDENLEKWRFANSCELWMRGIYGMIPLALRPTEPEIPAFARLFSSFFQTSFRIEENAPKHLYDDWGNAKRFVGSGRRRLVAGAPEGKKSSKGKEKIGEAARQLRWIALESLALEYNLPVDRPVFESLESGSTFSNDLKLWTYVHELHRRAHFASQGAPVREIWLSMDKTQRENITVAKVLETRERLMSSLRGKLKYRL